MGTILALTAGGGGVVHNTTFTLDAFDEDKTGELVWGAVRLGERWNGWESPVVDRGTLESILVAVAARTGEPHRWDRDVAVASGLAGELRL